MIEKEKTNSELGLKVRDYLKSKGLLNIEFKKGMWEEYFQHVYNQRFPFKPKFIQKKDCIVNGRNSGMEDGFDYTTIMTKKKYGIGTKIWFTCSFETYGAPLIMLTDSLTSDKNGNLSYGVGEEFVLWEHGFNVWDFFMKDGNLAWHALLCAEFCLKPGEKHEMCLEIMEKNVRATVGGMSILIRTENLPGEFYIGVTGCENINRLYSLKIEEA